MKIRALRVAQFRRFSEPVAIEDFSDGVNVLAGPNEMGKSTFFHALEAAFTMRHRTSGAQLDAMRPFSGGEPLVEADFDVAGTRWRIRKQFGRGNAATLSDVTSGRVVARNAEAEEQLGRLIGAVGELHGRTGLVWVRQQRALQAPDPDIDPITGREKQRGERSALEDAIRVEVDSVAGGDKVARVRTRLSEALNSILTAARNAPRKNGPLDIARREREEASGAFERAEQAKQAAEARLKAIADAMTDSETLRNPAYAATLSADLERFEAETAAQVQKRAARDVAREALQARLSEAKSARQTLDAAAARAVRRAELNAIHAQVVKLQKDVATLGDDINRNAATPARIDRLARLQHACDIADASLSSDAASVAVDVLPAGEGRVRVNEASVSASSLHSVQERIDISVDGLARIAVTAAGAERAAAQRLKRDTARAEIQTLLHDIGAATIEDARLQSDSRVRAVEELERARAKLSALAPNGVDTLLAEHGRLADPEQQALDATSALQDEAERCDRAARTAREVYDGLVAECLSDEDFRQLSADTAAARQAVASADRILRELTLRIEKLKSEQAGADEDGRAGQVDALRGAFDRHDAEVKRLEAEGKALLLLSRTLASVEARQRDTLFEPVSRRVQPHLSAVFGAADLSFRDAFAVSALARSGQLEDYASLSDGTREQISVLVRLAYAELLAARNFGVPLVLDDPLVYSDEERLEKICGVLNAAGQSLQIIVLTCRPTAFQKLNGRRVSMTAWRPEI